MIRKYKEQDLDRVMEIWLETNIKAHRFISKEYWINNYDFVRNILPESEIYVYELENEILGFIGISHGFIAGLFVDEKSQSKGIGRELLDYCKEKYSKLSLDVYKKNQKAFRFYKNNEFNVVENKIDSDNQELEYSMSWEVSE